MHLGVQHVHDGEDGEDGKGDGGAEGGSRAWRLLATWVSSCYPGDLLDGCGGCGSVARMFNKWSMHAPCTDHGRYKSPMTCRLAGAPPIHK